MCFFCAHTCLWASSGVDKYVFNLISLTVLNRTAKESKIFHACEVIFPPLCSLYRHKHTRWRTPTQTHTRRRHHHPSPPSPPLFLVIKASTCPRWPQATYLFIWGRRRESCHIPALHGRATSLSAVCVRTLSRTRFFSAAHSVALSSLFNAIPPSIFLPFSRSLFIFTHRPVSAWNKGRKCPGH